MVALKLHIVIAPAVIYFHCTPDSHSSQECRGGSFKVEQTYTSPFLSTMQFTTISTWR